MGVGEIQTTIGLVASGVGVSPVPAVLTRLHRRGRGLRASRKPTYRRRSKFRLFTRQYLTGAFPFCGVSRPIRSQKPEASKPGEDILSRSDWNSISHHYGLPTSCHRSGCWSVSEEFVVPHTSSPAFHRCRFGQSEYNVSTGNVGTAEMPAASRTLCPGEAVVIPTLVQFFMEAKKLPVCL
jgi:hypothetical protein